MIDYIGRFFAATPFLIAPLLLVAGVLAAAALIERLVRAAFF